MHHLKMLILRLIEIIGNLFPSYHWGNKVRGALYKLFLKKCGKNFQVDINVKLSSLHNIEVGNDVYIGYGSWIHGVGGGVTLKDEVMLGPYVTIVSGNHSTERNSYRYGRALLGKVEVGHGSWLGAKATIIAGNSIGTNTLVAANSTVTKDFGSNLVVAGSPAKIIKDLNLRERKCVPEGGQKSYCKSS